MCASVSSKRLINLLRGWPSTSLLPTKLLDNATHDVLQNKAVAFPAMLYGDFEGDSRLRRNVASWLTDFYQPPDPISDQRICITGGASQNLACLLQMFTDPVYTRNIWIVAPAYFLAFAIFEDAGFHNKLRAIPEDNEGIDMEYFRKEIKKSEDQARADGNSEPRLKPSRSWGKIYKHIIYAVPTFSNPSSKTMTLQRREELVRLARKYDALLITDDVYEFLQWPSSPTSKTLSLEKAALPRIIDVDRHLEGGAERERADGFGNAISNASFSKIFGPGLRTGFCEASAKLAYAVAQAGSTLSGGSPSQFSACVIAETLETGDLQKWVYDTLQPSYRQRYLRMVEAITSELVPLGVRLPQTDREVVGGYFIWLTLPEPLQGAVLAQRAKDEENLVIAQGDMFEVPGDTEYPGTSFANDIRLCFAWEDEDVLAEGILRLAVVIRKMQNEGADGSKAATTGTKGEAKKFW